MIFDFFSSKCPINVREKTWVELRMQWLVDRLGIERLRQVEVITPTPQHFPEPYAGSEEDIERLFTQVCGFMGVRRETVELKLFANDRQDHAAQVVEANRPRFAGLYETPSEEAPLQIVWIDVTQTASPMNLIATIAHELAHCVLLGEGMLTSNEIDHEFVTDMLPIFQGMGLFLANSVVNSHGYSSGGYGYWSISKQGYLPPRMLGYGLALFAWLRNEPKPHWARHLRRDARGTMNSGLRYLLKTDDSRCRRPGYADCQRTSADDCLVSQLRSETSGVRVAALWQLRLPEARELTTDEWESVVDCLDHHDAVVQSEAACAISVVNRPEEAVAEKLLHRLSRSGGDAELRSALARALGTQDAAVPTVLEELTLLLQDPAAIVVNSALTALKQVGRMAETIATPYIMEVFYKALVKCDGPMIANVVGTLNAVCESPPKQTTKYFEKHDQEMQKLAWRALKLEGEADATDSIRLPTAASLPVPLIGWRPSL